MACGQHFTTTRTEVVSVAADSHVAAYAGQ